MLQTAARTDWDTIEEWNDTYVVRTYSRPSTPWTTPWTTWTQGSEGEGVSGPA